MKEIAQRIPEGVNETDLIGSVHFPNGTGSQATQYSDSSSEILPTSEILEATSTIEEIVEANETTTSFPDHAVAHCSSSEDMSNIQHNGNREIPETNTSVDDLDSPKSDGNQVEAEWIEQFEPGVYITLIALRDGTRELKRVRFR